jgi:poly(3-hydroxybutyrate) depolymerase
LHLIYQTFDLVRRGLTPITMMLEAGHQLARHENNPWRDSLLHRAFGAACEVPARGLRAYPKQDFMVRDGKGGFFDERCVQSLPFADLIGFGVRDAASKPKVLVAAALSGHHATLLRDTMRAIARDFDPYITDWKDARMVPAEEGDFGLDDYIDYLITFLETLGPGTHVVATCQAAPPALVAAAVLAKRNPELVPSSLTLMAGPMDTRVNKTLINKVSDRVPLGLLKKTNIMTVPAGHPGSGRRVYPGLFQLSGFVAMNLLVHVRKYGEFVRHSIGGDHESAETFREFYDEYFSVLDMTESFYVESLEKIFYEHHIPTGRMTFRGEPVDFGALRDMALLTVEGSEDQFCSLGQTEAAHAICPNIPKERRRHHVQEGVGHYGIFSGSKYQRHIYPVIRDFIQATVQQRAQAAA